MQLKMKSPKNLRFELRLTLFTAMTLLVTCLLTSITSHAYYSVMDTGKIIPTGKYRLVTGPEAILSGDDGINVSARIDAGVSDSSNIRGLIGAGVTDFYAGMFYKYIPIPDYENQPALGFLTGATYSRLDAGNKTVNALTLQFQPIVSKEFDTEIGLTTPYVSLPIGLRFADSESEFPVNLVFGSEWKPIDFENLSFIGEIGLRVNESFNYINVAVIFEFDETEGIQLK